MVASTELASLTSKRLAYLLVATLAMLFLGLIYAWSIFASPIGLEYPDYASSLSQVFQVTMFTFCLSAVVGSQIIKRTSAQVAIRVAAVLFALGYSSSTLLVGQGAWALIVCYGIGAASGCGIAYTAIVTLINSWFPDRIGFSSGVQMMGMGLSTLIFGSLANGLFGIIGWQWVFVAIALIAFCILLALSFFVKTAPHDIAEQLQGEPASQAQTPVSHPVKPENLLKTKVFWIYCVWSIIIIACGLALIGSAKQGAESIDPAFAYGALFVGFVSAMNGVGRLINGALFDKFGLVFVMALSAITTIVATAGLTFAVSTGSLAVYLIAGVLIALPYSSVPVMASAFARQRYGAKEFAKNLSVTNLTAAAAAAMNIVLFALLGPVGDTANDNLVYGLFVVLSLVALASLVFFNKAYKSDLSLLSSQALQTQRTASAKKLAGKPFSNESAR